MYRSTLSLTSPLNGVDSQHYAQAALPIGGRRDDTGVWTAAENLDYVGIRSPNGPARSESLHRPRYPGPNVPIAAT
jgi:hypothetical protein